MYDHRNQYRCTIIRGKSQKEMDNFLPTYASIIEEICPCRTEDFRALFDAAFLVYVPEVTEKTLNNHRTEIVGKLFGMYYKSTDGNVYPSERTLEFLSDNDQPAFFKDICFKMQFPNGMDSPNKILERIKNKISIRQIPFLVKTLLYARDAGLNITKNDIGYYILNSLDVLQGKVNPVEIIEQIDSDKKNGIERKINNLGEASSYNMQHINEQINLIELANLVIVESDGVVHLNMREKETLDFFAGFWDKTPEFDVYSYGISTAKERKLIRLEWDEYFAKLSSNTDIFKTTAVALGISEKTKPTKGRTDLVAIGDEGEMYVFNYEKKRVKEFDSRLARKVIHLGKTRGLGYDIQSVFAEPGDRAEYVKYIEVKSTKRVTAPDIKDASWIDTINITRNEWVAALQHGDFYSIYRVYLVRGNVIIYVIENINRKEKEGTIKITPLVYRLDFSNIAVNTVI